MKNAVIYTRVSDPKQLLGSSLESQETICKNFAKYENCRVLKIFREEGISGKHLTNRTQLKELLNFVTTKSNNVDIVIVYKFDRFSRNVEEGLATISYLAKYQITVVSATEKTDESPMGKAMRSIMLTLGQLDNELKGERVKDNMQSVFNSGLWPHKCPIGYKRKYSDSKKNKGLPPVIDPVLAPIVKTMFERAAKGIYSKSHLARLMNAEGFSDIYEAKATHKIVAQILRNSFYYGKMYSRKRKEYSDGKHDPLVDELTWQKAYHYLILKKKSHKFQDASQYPLKGFLKCENCNHPMTSSPSVGNAGLVQYYECRNKVCTKKLRINIKKADEQFISILEHIKPSPRVTKLFQHMVFGEWDKVIAAAKKEIMILTTRINSLKKELESIRKAKDQGIYTVEEAKEEAERIRRDMRISEVERADIKIEQYDQEVIGEFTRQFLQNMVFLWNNLDLPKRQAFLGKVFNGELACGNNRKIRTISLSPSYELIQELSAKSGKNVSLARLELATNSLRGRRSTS